MGNKTISGYTTTLNCVEMDYPFIESIQSLLGFCDEVIVVDGGSEDGTIEALQPLAASDPRLKIHVEPIDYSTPNWALYQDGFQKARARSHCTGDFCWQNDNDEIILESDFKRIRRLPDAMQDHTMIMLPMVEFWGALDRVRGDFFSWKPRFSVNDPRITHGIPRDIKCYDMAGYEYARPFDSDGCHYIYSDTQEGVEITIPVPDDQQDINSLNEKEWEAYYFRSLEAFPHVYHVSWLDLARKIKHHRKFWRRQHASLYNLKVEDTAQHNMMFDKPWSEVTDQDIENKAQELSELGPRFFHEKSHNTQHGLTFHFSRPLPAGLLKWAAHRGISIPTRYQSSVNMSINSKPKARIDPPLISCVVHFNGDLSAIVQSINSITQQDYPNRQILLLVDATSPEQIATAKGLVQRYQNEDIYYYPRLRSSMSDQWNTGIRSAKGDYVVTLHCGDQLHIQYMSQAIEHLQGSGGNVFTCATALTSGLVWSTNEYNPFGIRQHNGISPVALFHRALWERAGHFREEILFGEHWDFWIRAASAEMRVTQSPDVLATLNNNSQIATTLADWYIGFQPLMVVANDSLYPTQSVLNAQQQLAHIPGLDIGQLEHLCKRSPRNWIVRLWFGTYMEQRGAIDQALQQYADAITVSGEKEWQPLYKASDLLERRGNTSAASEFRAWATLLRPDLIHEIGDYPLEHQPAPRHSENSVHQTT